MFAHRTLRAAAVASLVALAPLAAHAQTKTLPEQIADVMEHWFREGAADGFNVMPAWLPGSLDDFVDMVIPELQRRGLFRTEYEGTTLRENLGLPRPPSRWRKSTNRSRAAYRFS